MKIKIQGKEQKIIKTHRSFRRFARKLFASLLQWQSQKFQDGVMQKLQHIEETLEIMAREMARQSKLDNGNQF